VWARGGRGAGAGVRVRVREGKGSPGEILAGEIMSIDPERHQDETAGEEGILDIFWPAPGVSVNAHIT